MRAAEYAVTGGIAVQAYAPSGMAPDDPYFDVLRDIADRNAAAEVWVAVHPGAAGAVGEGAGGAIVGTVTWCPTGSPYGEIAAAGEAEFRMLAVAPQVQGRGVGRALVLACIDRARAEGATAVVLSSATWMTAAHRLYESLGFSRDPSRDWSPRPDIDLLAYRLALAAKQRKDGRPWRS